MNALVYVDYWQFEIIMQEDLLGDEIFSIMSGREKYPILMIIWESWSSDQQVLDYYMVIWAQSPTSLKMDLHQDYKRRFDI